MISAIHCRAARALLQLSRQALAKELGIDVAVIQAFEQEVADPGIEAKTTLEQWFEQNGVVFLFEDDTGGAGARLKYNRSGVKAIRRWESEGGSGGDDV